MPDQTHARPVHIFPSLVVKGRSFCYISLPSLDGILFQERAITSSVARWKLKNKGVPIVGHSMYFGRRPVTWGVAMIISGVLAACGTKTPKCDSADVVAALHSLFQKNAAPIFQHYVISSPDVFFILRVAEKLKMGMLDDRVTVFFPQGEAEKIKWSFKTTGISSSNLDAAMCTGHATYSRDGLSEGFDFTFEARATDGGGAYVKLTD